MTTVVIWLAGAFSLLALVLAGFAVARIESFPRPIGEQELQALLAKARADLTGVAEQVEELIEQARHQRRAAAGAKGGSSKREPEGPRFKSQDAYRRHLERGGARDREYEATLGWQ